LAIKNYLEIQNFVKGTKAEKSPIIPISAQLKCNIDAVCHYICEYIPIPKRNLTIYPEMLIIRSFDINKPGSDISAIKGGIAGGSILHGIIKVGDEIEIRPGIVTKDGDNIKCQPIKSRVLSLYADQNDLLYAIPGGLIGVGLDIDPALTKSNKLVGNVLGYSGHMPEIYSKIELTYSLLKKILGVSSDATDTKIKPIVKEEGLLLNVRSVSTGGRVFHVSMTEQRIKINLVGNPICAQIGDKVTLSRKINGKWRLIGWGNLESGKCANIVNDT